MSVSSSSSSSTSFDSAGAMAHIQQLEAQLAQANAEGNRVVAALQAEKVKSQQLQQQAAAVAAASSVVNVGPRLPNNISRVKLPSMPPFKGEIGNAIDNWLRRLVKQMDFYGESSFPNDGQRIKYAAMFFEGPAMDWWDGLPEVDKNKIITWSDFVDTLHSRFRPLQAAMIARIRLGSLKQTGSVAAYVNIFMKELTPISDMSIADQMHNFRQGLKPHIAQRVIEKLPKTLHEAMEYAILADAHFSKSKSGTTSYFYNGVSRSGVSNSSSQRATSSSSNDMDLSNINTESSNDEMVRSPGPVFHEEESSISSASSSSIDMREYNRMKVELKKYQAEAAISAIGSSSSSTPSKRTPVSKEEFDYCMKNRLCIKCKKPNHIATNCYSKYQPLKL